MSKTVSAILLIVIPLIIFHIGGFFQESSSPFTLAALSLFHPEDFGRGDLFTLLGIIAGTSLAGAVVAGSVFGRDRDTILFGLVGGPMLAFLVGILLDYIVLFNLLAQVNIAFAIIMIVPPIVASFIFLTEAIGVLRSN